MEQFNLENFIESEGLKIVCASRICEKDEQTIFLIAGEDQNTPSYLFKLSLVEANLRGSRNKITVLVSSSKVGLSDLPIAWY